MGALIQILLVEDDEYMRQLLETRINSITAFDAEVHHRYSLSGALNYLSAIRPQVILLDLGLPDSDGLETFLAVRKAAPTIPVVIMSGSSDRDTIISSIRNGAQDFLVKGPYTGDHLEKVISKSIDRQDLDTAISAEHKEQAVKLSDQLKDLYGSSKSEQVELVYEISKSLIAAVHGHDSDPRK